MTWRAERLTRSTADKHLCVNHGRREVCEAARVGRHNHQPCRRRRFNGRVGNCHVGSSCARRRVCDVDVGANTLVFHVAYEKGARGGAGSGGQHRVRNNCPLKPVDAEHRRAPSGACRRRDCSPDVLPSEGEPAPSGASVARRVEPTSRNIRRDAPRCACDWRLMSRVGCHTKRREKRKKIDIVAITYSLARAD